MTTTLSRQQSQSTWEQFCQWVTSTNNRLYVGWFGVLMIPTLPSRVGIKDCYLNTLFSPGQACVASEESLTCPCIYIKASWWFCQPLDTSSNTVYDGLVQDEKKLLSFLSSLSNLSINLRITCLRHCFSTNRI